MSLLKEILHNLRTSGQTAQEETSSRNVSIFTLFLTASFFILPMLVVTILTESLLGLDPEMHSINQLFKEASPWFIILFGVLIGPLTEELSFRLFLSKNYWQIVLGLSAFVTFFASIFLPIDSLGVYFLPTLLCTFVFCITIFTAAVKREVLLQFFSSYFTYIFWASIFSFGLIHVINFTDATGYVLLFAPLLAAPQLLMATVLTYVRMRYGFWRGFLYHSLHNAALLTPTVIIYKTFPDMLDTGSVPKELTTTESLVSIFIFLYIVTLISTIITFGIREIINYKRQKIVVEAM
jgi:membrane protease YdiL (CAAX protease family)